MWLFLLTALTMIAFAANSVLTRLAVDGGFIDPSSFALMRVLSGAVVLGMIMTIRGGSLHLLQRNRVVGACSLATYMAGFSLAYLTLDAGLGALILFGVVQVSMFAHGAMSGSSPTHRQVVGASIAFAGLLLALWPGPGGQANIVGAGFMIAAGLGWAVYTISGRASPDPLAATTANFILCLPVLAVVLVGLASRTTALGLALAILCGGVTSGLGYALWYTVLPRLQQSVAAVIQLSVPIIALIGGAVLLGETITPLVALATLLVISGIAIAVTSRSVQADRT
ncbi:DMT family transporter [Roseobacter sp. YSTF-M11]|uniref:DMT family transporter n=2 Tax=Roseobacter insulae TaxID=2859783 RepID=A0A9X1G133_9RHOB|nr:DMT family transporter [Roseobacter insulae]MBW4710618.1 DMT family transporter [Roseobacter insulae]